MDSALSEQHCRRPDPGEPALPLAAAQTLCAQLEPGWSIDAAGQRISRSFRFKNYFETIAFVNALAWIAHSEDHHPDLEVGYNRCTVHYSTHAVGGLSANDFICAAQLDRLARSAN